MEKEGVKKKTGVGFYPIPFWLRAIGIISSLLYLIFIVLLVYPFFSELFADSSSALLGLIFLSGAPIYVSWSSNLVIAYLFKKQRKVLGFIAVEFLSLVLYGLFIFVVFTTRGTDWFFFVAVGLFTITLAANMIIYPLVTFPNVLGTPFFRLSVASDKRVVEY